MSPTEILNLLFSGLALVIAAVTFFVHDRKIKRQEALLNEYQLKKVMEEEAEQKKAKVRANVIRGDKGKWVVKVFNSGKATARNINFEIIGDSDFYISSNPFPYEFLHHQDSTEMMFHLHTGSPDKVNVKLSWEDDFQSDNIHQQILTL